MFSCADDCAFKSFDLRVNPWSGPSFMNKRHHQAGVTFVRSFLLPEEGGVEDSNYLITGSYDGTMALWDRRKMGRDPLLTKDFDGKSVWDLKVHPSLGHCGIASIYDGYLFDLKAKETKCPEELFTQSDEVIR